METKLVNYIIAAIYNPNFFEKEKIVNIIEKKIGKIDYISIDYNFSSHTNYYLDEMGEPLYRFFVSLKELNYADKLVNYKLLSDIIEKNEFSIDGKRKVNLDVGYIDYDKLILASFKYRSQKIYLGSNVWADLILIYTKKNFKPLEWTFHDFKTDLYYKTLKEIRDLFIKKLREVKNG